MRWKLGNRRAPRRPLDAAVATVLGIELLSKTEMRHYFPDCTTVLSESFLGLVKSLIALKRPDLPRRAERPPGGQIVPWRP